MSSSVCKPTPWQTLSITWPQNTTHHRCSQPAARLLYPLHLEGQQLLIQIDKGWHSAGSAPARTQRVRSKFSNSILPCFAKPDCAKFHLTVERTHGHTKPHTSLVPRITDASCTVHLVQCITSVTFAPGSAPPFRKRPNSTWTAEFWHSVATRLLMNTRD